MRTNLTSLFTDIADAIRSKKGTSAQISPQDFASEIQSITTGGSSGGNGGASTVSAGVITYYDYDGTVLHSFSADAFAALAEHPALPEREGLVCQGWNWDLTEAKAYVAKYGMLNIGANYITDDGKTRLYIRIAAEGRMDVPLHFSQTVANGVTIDWGDGSATETLSGTGNKSATHKYASIGDYCITLSVTGGCTLGLGHNSSSYCVMSSKSYGAKVYCNMLQYVEIGMGVTSINDYTFQCCYSLASIVIPDSVTRIGNYAFQCCCSLASIVIPDSVTSIGNYAFYDCYSLASIVIPDSVTSIGSYAFYDCYSLASIVIPDSVTRIGNCAFQYCYSLASIVIPDSVTSINDYAFQCCYSLASIVIPDSVTSINNYAFYNCYSLASIVIPDSVTSINNYAFYSCCSLASIVIPDSVTSIGNYAFYSCYSLASIVIPDSVTSIGNYAFYDCYGMAFYDFSALTVVPSLSATSAFNNISSDCKIIVPDALYDTWIAATNWSTYASYIIKKSDWDEL